MRRTTATALTALSLVGTLTATLAATTVTASAESLTVADATSGDVAQFSDEVIFPRGVGDQFTNIQKTAVDHRNSQVVAVVDIADVSRELPSELQVQLNTLGGKRYLARVSYGPEAPTTAFLQDLDNPERELTCEVGSAVRTVADQVVVRVPNSCLRNPRAVRFGAKALTYYFGSTLVDDARRKETPSSVDQPIKIGPRELARG